jgi:transposase
MRAMRIETILNNTAKYKSFVYKNTKLIKKDADQHIEAEIIPRKNGAALCSHCRRPASCYDHQPRRRFEHVPLWNIPFYFYYTPRRVSCNDCGVKIEHMPWSDGKRGMTRSMMIFLASWAKTLCWQETARRFNASWRQVFSAIEYVVDWGMADRNLENIESIGIDEVAWKKGQNHYATLVYQIDHGLRRLLWVGEHRTIKTGIRFFRWLGKTRTQKLKHVCSDMWQAYIRVIKKKAPQALHILDRFHIVANINKAIDEIRAGEHKQLQKDGFEPVLKKSRWCLLKRPENLTESQEYKLTDLLKYNLKSVRAYLLKEDFQGFWNYTSPVWAGKFLDRWCTRVMRSKLKPMKKQARSIRKHKQLILNWFIAKKQFSSGIVEGLNTKIKLATKKAYGFRTFHCFEIAIFHQLGGLNEPPDTHRFC